MGKPERGGKRVNATGKGKGGEIRSPGGGVGVQLFSSAFFFMN